MRTKARKLHEWLTPLGIEPRALALVGIYVMVSVVSAVAILRGTLWALIPALVSIYFQSRALWIERPWARMGGKTSELMTVEIPTAVLAADKEDVTWNPTTRTLTGAIPGTEHVGTRTKDHCGCS